MSKNIKIIIIAGARPNFMKVAPIIRCIRTQANDSSRNGSYISYRLVHTGQHYDKKMSDIFFTELGIPAPDINLEVGSGSHAVQTANIMTKFEPVCEREKPDWVVVVGDVNSTMACTLVCSKLGIKVAHVEAGLRSYDRSMPEEVNRIVTDALADMLLTPSADADENLKREGVAKNKIRCVGNIMIDSLLTHLTQVDQSSILQRYGLRDGHFAYVTLHRPSNVDNQESLEPIIKELSALSHAWNIVFPAHPRTLKRIEDFNLRHLIGDRIKLIEPIGYIDSLALTKNARFVLTDSGGLQEESTYFRTPCLTLRPNTERPVTVTNGSNRLTTVDDLPRHINEVLQGPVRLGQIPPLWDGRTAERILSELAAG